MTDMHEDMNNSAYDEVIYDDEGNPISDSPAPGANGNRLSWVPVGEVKRRTKVMYHIDGFIAPAQTIIVYGLPKANKSTIVLDGMLAAADNNGRWMGLNVRRRLLCVYVAAERSEVTEARILAYKAAHGIPADEDFPLAVIRWRPNMKNPDDVAYLIWEIRQIERYYDMPADWIAIDTLTQTFGSGSQSSDEEMAAYGKAVVGFRQAINDQCNVTIIHHEKKAGKEAGPDGGGPKGAIDLLGIVEGAFQVRVIDEPEKRQRALYCYSHNNVASGHIFDFTFDVVGYDKDVDEETGKETPVTEIVARYVKTPEGREVDGLVSSGAQTSVSKDSVHVALIKELIREHGDVIEHSTEGLVARINVNTLRSHALDAPLYGARQRRTLAATMTGR